MGPRVYEMLFYMCDMLSAGDTPKRIYTG